jgi:hypothetical protein
MYSPNAPRTLNAYQALAATTTLQSVSTVGIALPLSDLKPVRGDQWPPKDDWIAAGRRGEAPDRARQTAVGSFRSDAQFLDNRQPFLSISLHHRTERILRLSRENMRSKIRSLDRPV